MKVLLAILLAALLGVPAPAATSEDADGLAEVLRQAMMLYGQRKLEPAAREFQRVLRFDATNRIALHHMARIQAIQGKLMDSVDTIRQLQRLGVALQSDVLRETIRAVLEGIVAQEDLKTRADLLVHLRETLVGLSARDNHRIDVHLMCLYAKLQQEQLYQVVRERYFHSAAPTPELFLRAGLCCLEYDVTLEEAAGYFYRCLDLLDEFGKKLAPTGNVEIDQARRVALAARRTMVEGHLGYTCYRLGWRDAKRNRIVAGETRPDVEFAEVEGLPAIEGRGLAVGDYDGDGYEDLCVAGRILRNQKGRGFEDVTATTGVKANATALPLWLDCDGDGRPDLLLADLPRLALWRNYGDGTFVDATASAGLGFALPGFPGGMAAGDWDGDGRPDLFLSGFEVPGRVGAACPNLLLRNTGGRFVDATARAGLQERRFSSSRGAAWCDLNDDGLLDLYVANDRLQPNQLWVNQGNGRFLERAEEAGVRGTSGQGTPAESFGNSVECSWGDVNGDGALDLVVAEATAVRYAGRMDSGAVYLNGHGEGGKRFVNHMAQSGIAFEEKPTGSTLADFDNDGDLDCCRTEEGARRPAKLYRNDGGAHFDPVTWRAGIVVFDARSHAWFDKDNDGDLDLVVGGNRLRLFENQGNDNSWLQLHLEGAGGNPAAIGTRVTVQLADNRTRFVRDVTADTGSGAQGSSIVHFGLGKQRGMVRVSIRWPGGEVQEIDRVQTQRRHVVEQQRRSNE